MKSLAKRLGHLPFFSSTTGKNLSYLMTAEGCSRVVRIAVTVMMARVLSVADFGTLAVALTLHELIAVLAHNGFGLKLLKQPASTLAAAANSAFVLSFGWALAMFAGQWVLGSQLAWFGFADAGFLLQGLAPVHLLLPLALTHVHMIHRGGKLGAFAVVGTLQTFAECLCTLALLFAGCGLWAVVIARFVSTIVWVVGFRRAKGWSFCAADGFLPMTSMFVYTLPVLLSEYSKSIRQWGDNLLVGGVLGQEMLGLYYFAKNSGLGISLSLCQISVATITPRLAEITREATPDRQLLRRRLVGRFSVFLTVVIGAQALLAPLYVPVLFGASWEPAVLVLALMCVSAIPRCIADLHACLARNSGLTALEMQWNSVYTLCFLFLVYLVSSAGLEALAVAMIALNTLMALIIGRETWRRLASLPAQNRCSDTVAQVSG